MIRKTYLGAPNVSKGLEHQGNQTRLLHAKRQLTLNCSI
jgi:hypothetical protein